MKFKNSLGLCDPEDSDSENILLTWIGNYLIMHLFSMKLCVFFVALCFFLKAITQRITELHRDLLALDSYYLIMRFANYEI